MAAHPPATVEQAERARRWLVQVLPPEVRIAAAPIAAAELTHPEEAALVERAVDKRRAEFATGRRLAHGLLDELGVEDAPLLPGERRAPCWPAGVVGSISHGAGLCVVAVGSPASVPGLGLDVEVAEPLQPGLWERILRPEERDVLPAGAESAGRRAKLVFAAKEALYKALAGELTRVLGFDEARLGVDDDGGWRGEVVVADAGVPVGRVVRGHWCADSERVLVTAVPEVDG